jgi:GxxExxY protein
MQETEITGAIVDAAIKVHKILGPGLFESVYQKVWPFELEQRGLIVPTKQKFPIHYGELLIPEAFELDLIVEEQVIVEMKSVEKLAPVHSKQLLTYLRLLKLRLGLLINFNVPLLKDGIVRIVNGFESAALSSSSSL